MISLREVRLTNGSRTLFWSRVAANLLAILVTRSALGTTIHVPSEYPTIQGAVDIALPGDTVLVAPGIYSDSAARLVDGVVIRAGVHLKDGVALLSESGPYQTVLDMLHVPQVQHVMIGFGMPSEATRIEGFTLTGTIQGQIAARISQSGGVTFRDCIWRETNGDATSSGSFTGASTDIVFEHCTFRDCVNVGGDAAGPIVYSGSLTARDCTFQDMTGLGLGAVADFTPRDFIVEDCSFVRCKPAGSEGGGGGIGCLGFNGAIRISRCTFVDCVTPVGGGGIGLGNGNATALIENNLFWKCGVTNAGSAGGGIRVGQPCIVQSNTFVDCFGGSGLGGMSVSVSTYSLSLTNNIVVGSIGPGAAVRGVAGISTGDCNVFYNNPGGNAVGYVLGPNDRDIDPLFCDPTNGDFTVNAASPCLPPNSLGCDFIGAFPQGCGTVSVTPKSWGQIKGSFR